jgi:TonB family protein
MIILLTTNLLIPELKAQSKLEQQNDSINFGQITSPHLDSLTFGDNDIFPTYKFDGELGLYKFLNDSIRYPEEFIEGKVYVSFIVDTIGKIKDAIILKGLNEESNKEVLRVVSKLEFIPGESKGKKVEVKYNLSFIFRRF